MEFVLNFIQPAADYEKNALPENLGPGIQAWKLYMEAMGAQGVLRGANRLVPFGATTVRVRQGVRQVQDGPFADSKDLLGGYVVIDVPSLDEALLWAARSPSSQTGATEVWPVMAMNPPAA